METYIIKYILKKNKRAKDLVACITIDLDNDNDAISICKDFQSKGNFIKEIYNKSQDITLYHYKKANLQHVLN